MTHTHTTYWKQTGINFHIMLFSIFYLQLPLVYLSVLNTYLMVPHFKKFLYCLECELYLSGRFWWLFSHSYNPFIQKINLPRFIWKTYIFQFRAMSFGPSPAPRVLTKVVQAAISSIQSPTLSGRFRFEERQIQYLRLKLVA